MQPVVNPVDIDNRLYRVCKHSTGCQTCLTTGFTNGCIVYTAGCQIGCTTRFDNRLNEQWLFVQHGCQTVFVKPGCTTGLTTNSHTVFVKPVVQRFDNRLNEQCCSSVSCIQTFNRLSNRFGCLSTRYSRLSNRLYNRYDNRLYRVNGVYEFDYNGRADMRVSVRCERPLRQLDCDFVLDTVLRCNALRSS